MRIDKLAGSLFGAGAAALFAGAATAQENIGVPRPAQMGFQPAATDLAQDLQWLDGFILYIIAAITIFVTALLVIILIRFRASANPTPARFTHNSVIEVIWTVVPIIILVIIAVPSLNLLHKQVNVPETDMTIKATGNQWYWSYSYPDEGLEFDAFMIGAGMPSFDAAMADEDVRANMEKYNVTRETWLLQTDTEIVIPVGKKIRMQVTAGDVIHSWTIPAFGVKIDGVPGRLNETWFQVDMPGRYYGQCSELCGKDHSYMPIVVRALPQDEYDAWLEQAKELYASNPAPRRVQVASAE
ncbi:cytochrome c oxidase subunit II [Rhodovulum sp. DZ06]|uniref:cytochrome c oxidase subunit II n=1 Tax=Rhodovulum sp. DZ06 TaxID=3425126 RepID=UPI003D32B5E1